MLVGRPLLIAALLVLAGVTAASAQADECRPSPGTELITREDITNAGLARLSEVFRLSDRWYAYSIDGYRWDAQVGGLSPASHARWSLLIDGKPVDLGLMGIQNLDVVPIHVNEIACIELTAGPAVIAGALRPFGTIHITTHRPRTGMTIGAGASAGNEINDPGPFRYTPQETPNIDRIGPIGTGRIELRSHGRFARVSGKLDEFHVADLQMELRGRDVLEAGTKPRINTEAVAFTAGMKTAEGSHSLLGGHSSTDDLLFFPSSGIEIPATRRFDFIGGEGMVALGSAEMRYRGSYLSHELSEHQSSLIPTVDFRKRIYSGALEARMRSGPVELSAGWSLDVTDVRTPQELADTKTMVTRAFGGSSVTVGGVLEAMLHGAWIQSDERAAYELFHQLRLTPTPNHRVDVSGSLSRRTMSMDETLWRWVHLGYALPDVPRMDEEPESGGVERFTLESEPRLASIELAYFGDVSGAVQYSLTGYFRSTLSEYLPSHELSFNERSTGLFAQTRLRSFVSGQYAGISAGVRVELFRRLVQQLTYVAEGVTAGDGAFRDIHARVPAQRLAYSITYSPVDRFSLFARVRYQTATVWQEYQPVTRTSNGFYTAELPGALLVDLAATKRLWKDHVVANVSIRNLMNEAHRMHPMGAIFDMAFHFAVRLSFNSEAGF